MANGVALDKSGNDNHGSPVNIATSTFYVAGKIGQALKFDGVNDYVNVGAPASLNLTNNYTLSMWVRLAGFGGGLIRQSNNSSNGAQYDKYSLRPVSATSLVFATGNGTTGDSDSFNFNMTFDTWTMVTCTLSSSNVKSCYKNGALVGTATNDVDTSLVTPTVGLIGTLRNAAGNFSNGVLDDIRIYNRALSANEIKQLYNLGAGTKQAVSPKITPMASTTPCSTGSGLSCGLVGYWTFDGKDMANGVALDKSGNDNHGSPVNIATSTFYVAGKIGQALNFDGVNDYVNVRYNNAFDFSTSNSFTYSFWAKYNNSSQTSKDLIIKAASSKQNPRFFIGSDGSFNFRLYDGTSANNVNIPLSASIKNRTWHHFVGLNDGGTVKVYIDGIHQGTDSSTVIGTIQNSGAISIGAQYGANAFNGSLDDVRVYNRALTVNEIKQIYNLGSGTKQAVSPKITPMASTTPCSTGSGLSCGLVGYWTFDGKDMANGVALDKSGNFATGTPSGIATSTFYAPGKIGQGLNFDGVDDYVNITSTSNLKNISSGAVSLWFKSVNQVLGDRFIYAQRTGSNNDRIYLLIEDLSKDFQCGFADNANAISSNNNIAGDNRWHFGLIKWNSTTAECYLDGVLIGTPYTGTLVAGTPGLNIGALQNNPSTYGFTGFVDDVRVYNRVLSANEITQLYNLGR